jgi:hypothetical protein
MANALMLGGGAPTLTLDGGARGLARQGRQVRRHLHRRRRHAGRTPLRRAEGHVTAPGAGEHQGDGGLRRDLRSVPGQLQGLPQAWRPRGRLPPCSAVLAASRPGPGSGESPVRRLDGPHVRHLVPFGPHREKPGFVRPCAVDRRGGRLRQAQVVPGRVLHERVLP